MYRSGWASKKDQEVVLAVKLIRSAFDELLGSAVYSSFKPSIYESRDAWKSAVASSDVRLQWDPDHSPDGGKLERRAIQLGLRGVTLEHYTRDWIIDITDVSEFVREQRGNAVPGEYHKLIIPSERVYPVQNQNTAEHLRLDHGV